MTVPQPYEISLGTVWRVSPVFFRHRCRREDDTFCLFSYLG
ncbi:hypothetical protein ERO13_A03G002450v2 [Gossypium hirsutum]|uniref:Uncharacterized protein n=1 Tax=Gossypium tomentosum TaxID=34277 RepID=A0A5D2R0K8_GOSTO|nr:hypothetical protein ERO13_A03G002450v2 [Gossypium hirsutum]TYI34431.1 hypothetical protein ES332_A03G008500v1 [Gossypium tomentosum]